MITSNIEQVIFNIRNMSMKEFCARVNKLARATRYCTDDNNVCELLDTSKSTVKVVHFDPDYFGSETAYIVIDDELDNAFKELFIQDMLNGWDDYEKMDYINSFVR